MDNDIRPGVGHNTTPGYSPFNNNANPSVNTDSVSQPINAPATPAVGTPLPTQPTPSLEQTTPSTQPVTTAMTGTLPTQATGTTTTINGSAIPAAHQFGETTPDATQPIGSPITTMPSDTNTPTPSMTFGSVTPNGPIPPMATKRKSPLKWVLIIGIPVIILLGVLVWYLAVFNNKYNIVRSALYGIMGQRDNSLAYNLAINDDEANIGLAGTMKYLANGTTSGDISIKFEGGGASLDVGQISFAGNNDSVYLRLDPSEALAQLGIDLTSTGLANQWIEINADSLETSSSSLSSDDSADIDKATQCIQNAQDLMNNRANQQQIVDALLDTDFLVVGDSGKDDHGTFYELSLNGANFAAFYNRLMDSNYMQSTLSCLADNGIDADTDLDDSQLSDIGADIDKINPSIKFWIKGTFSRQLTRAQVNMNVATTSDDVTASMTIDFDNQTPTIEMPTDTMTLQEIVEQNPTGIMQLLMLNPATIGNSSSSSNTGSLTQQTDAGSNVIDFTLGEGVQIVE